MKVGVLELLVESVPQTWGEHWYNLWYKKILASLTPQAVAAWCRQLGHEVYYATYYGQCDPQRLLPDQLDMVFIATYTQASALAYALSKLYRRAKTVTVIGGPHARSFPMDCLRFFDFVVRDCDKTLLRDLFHGAFSRGTVITSGRRLEDIPSVAERLPEIRTATFTRGRPTMLSNVPLLSSVGCPYHCDFCLDWNNPYVLLPPEHLTNDLRYISTHLPGILVGFHDPNFGVKFDQVLALMETLPARARNPYAVSISLSILRGPHRLQRLQHTHCVYVGPGIESWASYSHKAGVGSVIGQEKWERVVAHVEELYQYIPYVGANFVLGTDVDAGAEPFELTKAFMRRLPFVWPMAFIPVPYGGTPLYDAYLAEDRILQRMPFSFYYLPYLVVRLKHYDPLEYYDRMVDLYAVLTSSTMLVQRVRRTRRARLKLLQAVRTCAMRTLLAKLRDLRDQLRTDKQLRAFHDGTSQTLPAYYRYLYTKQLGAYAELMSDADMTPALAETAAQ
jgi:radical SAM superfamily enzyme YgiQ (UPF0313 family)